MFMLCLQDMLLVAQLVLILCANQAKKGRVLNLHTFILGKINSAKF